MSEHKAQRGRPKGSGIDDRTRLQTIAAMIAANPELKPTTAIKSIGITDPSIIRRLRDKFHAAQTELMAELHGTAKAAPVEVSPRAVSHAAPAEATSAHHRAMAVQIAAPVKRSQSASASEAVAATAVPIVSVPPAVAAQAVDASQWLATICGFGLTAASTAMEAHMTFAQQLVRMPQVALALRQHVVFNELAMAWCRPQLRSAQGLH